MKIIILIGILFISISCNKSNKNQKLETKEFTLDQKQIILEKVGQIYYKRNCTDCHGRKGVTDQFLEYAIKSDQYEFEFLRAYLTNQDSLLKNKNLIALGLKDTWNNHPYLHKFDMNDEEIKAILHYLKK